MGLQKDVKAALGVKEATEMENRRLLQEITHLRVAAVATAKELDVWRHTCSRLRTKLQVGLRCIKLLSPLHCTPVSADLVDLPPF